MRHRKKVKKLGRTKSHREATLRNLARAIIEHHQVKTTLAKAKAARSYIERLITYGKKDTVAARRLAFKRLQNRTLVKALFDEIAPAFAERSGGYTRIIKLGRRRGDGAELAILQLVGFEKLVVEEKAKPKKSKKKEAAPKEEAPKAAEKKEAAKAEEVAPAAEEAAEAKEEKAEEKTEPAVQEEAKAEEKTEEKSEQEAEAEKKEAAGEEKDEEASEKKE